MSDLTFAQFRRIQSFAVYNLAGRSYTEICTLDFNCSWRKVEFSFKTCKDKTPYIALPVVDGVVHWINSSPGKDSDVSIIAFDIDTEKYKMITGPKACGGKVHCKLSHVVHLMEFRGELQLMHICTGTSEVSIWSMKDGEWSKLYTLGAEVAPKEMKELTFRHWPYYYPIAWIGNETLFWASDPNVDNHYLVFYNHHLRRFCNFDKKGVFTHRISAVFPYVDSLVFPYKLPLSKFVSFRK